MTIWITSILVPLLIVWLIPKYFPPHNERSMWLLYLAGFLFFIAYRLPSPLIDGQQTQFMTHLIGGGIFTGLVWLYLITSRRWKPKSILLEAISLFALVSALGATNELFEIFLYEVGQLPLGLTDTSWDLLANTLGAGLFFVMYLWVYHADSRHR